MRNRIKIELIPCLMLVAGLSSSALAQVPTIDFETPGTGSNIVADGSFSVPSGTITLHEDTPGDASINGFGTFPNDLPQGTYGNRLVEAGSSGSVGLDFDFDVSEITFNFGGDGGGFEAQVLDGSGTVLDSIAIADLPASGQAPGPTTLSGVAIRSLRFEDPIGGAAIDDLIIVTDSIAPSDPTATFMVSKQYSDGNTDPVMVTLTCNGGLPLQQSFEISDGNPVTFTLTNFVEGDVDCEVTEEGTAGGYTPSFDNGTVISELSCEYSNVTSGAYTCAIFNAADAGLYTVSVDWILPELVGVEEDYSVDVTITCDADIMAIDETALPPSTQSITVSLDDGDSVVLKVDTAVGAMCSAEQEIVQSGVEPEVSAGCNDAELTAGGSAECAFTNTVFYEGIPTLSQYGLALLALLMLGVGFISVRRFS